MTIYNWAVEMSSVPLTPIQEIIPEFEQDFEYNEQF